MVLAGVWANSLTLLGETLRGSLMFALEVYLLLMLRRIHRQRLIGYDYGTGKMEQFGNLLVGAGMVLGAVWLGISTVVRLIHPPFQPVLGMAMAAVVAFANVAINAITFHSIWRAGRNGICIITNGQVRSRLGKLIASGLAAVAIAVNAIWDRQDFGHFADSAGSMLLIATMVAIGIGMWREALPHLFDRTLDEAKQMAINRVLVERFDDYDSLGSVRSRLVGRVVFVELMLGFARHRTIGDIQRVTDGVADAIRAAIPDAQVIVTPVSIDMDTAALA